MESAKVKFNPNPITKFICTVLLSFTVLHTVNDISLWLIAITISMFFVINGYKKDAAAGIIVFALLFKCPDFGALYYMPAPVKMFLGLVFVVRMFIIPFMAGKFLIKTSDVGTIMSSLDKLKVPYSISIPIAVMFRFFPSFREERNNIKLAMKIRGINSVNPISYLEYVTVPLLVTSSNIADDIAKAAETKCIENPVGKTRYSELKIGIADFVYGGLIIALVIGGWLW